jgi:hypothetical protein
VDQELEYDLVESRRVLTVLEQTKAKAKVQVLNDDALARSLAQLLELSKEPPEDNVSHHRVLNILKGKSHESLVDLLAGDCLTLVLAGHAVPLADLQSIKAGILSSDSTEDVCHMDQSVRDPETPETRKARLKGRVREEKAKGTKAFIQFVAKEEGISTARLKQLSATKPVGGKLYASSSPTKKSLPPRKVQTRR